MNIDKIDSKELISVAARNIIPLGIGSLGLLLILIGLGQSLISRSNEPVMVFEEADAHEKSELIIDIEGAVMNPGVYKLDSSSRTVDALAAAGGLSSEADRDWVEKNINLAGRVTDGLKIYIPRVGEDILTGASTSEVGTGGPVVNINTASSTDLETLPGIGEVTAQKIIEGRPYVSIDELIAKKVIGEATFEKIKNQIAAN
jgi:competence protein ComEA